MSRAKFREARLTVEGRGPFPLDMLRYGSCCPATERDAGEIGRADYAAPRQVKLRRFFEPGASPRGTPARWSSFLWVVVAAEVVP